MLINAGFYRVVKIGKKKAFIHSNVQNIYVPGNWNEVEISDVLKVLQQHKPSDNYDWMVQGFYLTNNEEAKYECDK